VAKKEKGGEFETLIGTLNESCGDGAIALIGQWAKKNIPVIPTGAFSLDLALGVGGIPRGRITEIYGVEGCGKTTLCLHVVANAQKDGGNAAFIDVEHALDMAYTKNLGVDLKRLAFSQPDSGEQALNLVVGLLKSNLLDVIVIDSVAALITKAELEGEIGDMQMAPQARLLGQALKKITPLVGKSNTALIFINQLRSKIGAFMGDPNTTPGGRALKFFSSVRISMAKIQTLKDKEEKVGGLVEAKILKNKVAAPYKTCQFEIYNGTGISAEASILDIAIKLHIVEKGGAGLSFGDAKLGHKMAAIKMLRDNPNLGEEIKKKVMEKIALAEEVPPDGSNPTEVQDK
jgi:recombination protein RecA